MTGRPRIISDEPPPLKEIDFVPTPPNQRAEYWNKFLARRRFEVVCDPSEDFRRGAKFGPEDLWGSHTSYFSQPVRSYWPAGLVMLDVQTGKRYRINELHYLIEETN